MGPCIRTYYFPVINEGSFMIHIVMENVQLFVKDSSCLEIQLIKEFILLSAHVDKIIYPYHSFLFTSC